jgi:hypothetical protein
MSITFLRGGGPSYKSLGTPDLQDFFNLKAIFGFPNTSKWIKFLTCFAQFS